MVTPGHIFPQVSDGQGPGGAGLALRLVMAAGAVAGAGPVAAVCTILGPQGEVASDAGAARLARSLGLATCPAARMPEGMPQAGMPEAGMPQAAGGQP